jgi:hypothetical protein
MTDQDAPLARLKARMVDWMTQRGLGDDCTFERPDDEAIDFDFCYPVVPIAREEPLNILRKQRAIEVMPSESWINVSDRVGRALGLPLGTCFRIYPVIGDVENRDQDDHSYSLTWEKDKQYWLDIVYDEGKDIRGRAKEVRMIDGFNRVDSFVVPTAANIHEIVELWKRVMEIPDEIQIEARSGNGFEIFWGYCSAAETIPCTLRTCTERRASSPVQTMSRQIRLEEFLV